MYIVQSASGNILEHQATCLDRPEGSYVIDLVTSEFYIVTAYNAVDEDDEEIHTAILNCNQDTGVATGSAVGANLVGHSIVFVSNWAETAAYFGSIYDPVDPISTTIRIRLGSFDLADYPEDSTERADLEAAILSDICAINSGAQCSQISIVNLVEGSIIVVFNIDASDNDITKLIDIERNLRNGIASYNSDPHQTPDSSNPLANVDRFYWNNKHYEVIFDFCPTNQYITLEEGETTATVSWMVPTAEFTNGDSVTPQIMEGMDIENGSEQPVGSYFFRYIATENGAFAPPCTFFVKITAEEIPDPITAQLIAWMTNDVMLVLAILSSLLGIITFCVCWRKFGVKHKDTEEEYTNAMPDSDKKKSKKIKKKTKADIVSSDSEESST